MAGFGTALVAALVIGLIKSTLGLLLKLVTLPLTIVTFGLFLLGGERPHALAGGESGTGLRGAGFVPVLLGAILLAALNTIVRHLVFG